MLAIRLPEKIEKRLERLAKRTGRTKTYYAREAILQHLEDLEDIYLAEKRLADIRAGRTRTIPLEEVMHRYGLKDKTARKKTEKNR
jgi:RHH-type transcriptional regulator, rel operon repressor / antitoxin RelB